MPIYEYYCKDCGTRFEVLRPISEADTPINCQTCDSAATMRCLSLFNASSGGRVIGGGISTGCAGCVGGSCASCGR